MTLDKIILYIKILAFVYLPVLTFIALFLTPFFIDKISSCIRRIKK
jgi:hypothetical protein